MLIIDDMFERHEGLSSEYSEKYTIDSAYNYQDACYFLDLNEYDLICFDHDLNDFEDGSEKTGSSVARYMANNQMTCPEIRVHSNNKSGSDNIISIIKSGEVSDNCYYKPFGFN